MFYNVWVFTWRVSDCEELVGHTGTNMTNYFMFQWMGTVRCPLLLIPQELYVPDVEQRQPEGGFSGTSSCGTASRKLFANS